MWNSSTTSQDGLAEAIQLLSCRPSRIYQPQPPQPPLGPPFIEEPTSSSVKYKILFHTTFVIAFLCNLFSEHCNI